MTITRRQKKLPDSKRITISLDAETYAAIEARAAKEGVSLSTVIADGVKIAAANTTTPIVDFVRAHGSETLAQSVATFIFDTPLERIAELRKSAEDARAKLASAQARARDAKHLKQGIGTKEIEQEVAQAEEEYHRADIELTGFTPIGITEARLARALASEIENYLVEAKILANEDAAKHRTMSRQVQANSSPLMISAREERFRQEAIQRLLPRIRTTGRLEDERAALIDMDEELSNYRGRAQTEELAPKD